jgi:hypothetical protein
MIWQLVKRDPAWRNALNCAAVSAVACLALPREFVGMFGLLVCMCWFLSQPQQRATLFQAGLPIRACDLFVARILTLFAGVWLPVASGAALLLLLGKPAEEAATLVEIGAAFSVLVLVAQSSRVREIAGSIWAQYYLLAFACGAGVLIRMLVPRAVVLAACALLCPLLFWNIWRQLPTTFEVLPAKLTRQVSSQGSSAAPAFVWWPILRSIFQPLMLLFLPIIACITFTDQWQYTAIWCCVPVVAAVEHMSWALNLPVRRHALLAAAVGPWLTLFLAAVLLSHWFGPKPSIRLERSASYHITDIRPPLEFWRTGRAPIIESPWGEVWRPATMRLGGIAVFNPYNFGPANSARFFEWQFRRATEAVYGQPIDYADFNEPRLRPLMRQARLSILNLAACACWAMLMVNVVLAAMHWRFRRVFVRQNAPGLLLIVPTLGVLLIDWAPVSHGVDPLSLSLVNALLLRVSALLPASLPAVALAAVLPVGLLWWTAARLFRGVEIPQAVPVRQ